MAMAENIPLIRHRRMLVELYVSALLADERAVDEILDVWAAGVISNEWAALARCLLASAAQTE
jgi:hypothetical protein